MSEDARHIEFHTLRQAPAVARGTYDIATTGSQTTVYCTTEISFHGSGHILRPVVQRNLDQRMISYPKAMTRQLDQLAKSRPS